MKIITNNHWREMEYRLPDWKDNQDELELSFLFKGRRYFLSEFLSLHDGVYIPNTIEEFNGYDGYLSDSYFTGVLIKLSPSGEGVQVAWYYN